MGQTMNRDIAELFVGSIGLILLVMAWSRGRHSWSLSSTDCNSCIWKRSS